MKRGSIFLFLFLLPALTLMFIPNARETFMAQFDEEAVWMQSNKPAVEGLENIRKLDWVRAIKDERQIVDIDGGGLAYVRFRGKLLLDYEGAEERQTKGIFILREQPDGKWLIFITIGNSELPPSGS